MKTSLIITALAAVTLTSAQAGDGNLALNKVWSRIADVNGEFGSVESAEFSPDGRFIVTGTKFDNTVRVFKTVDGTEVWMTEVPQEIERVAWTMDGKRVAAVSEDAKMRVFDARNGKLLATHDHDNGIDGLTASHDGRFLVSGQERVEGVGKLRIFDGQGKKLLRTIDFPGTVNEVDFSEDDRLFAAVGDYTARLYSVPDFEVIHEWTIPSEQTVYEKNNLFIITKLSPDGKLLAVGGSYGWIYLYDTETGEEIRRLNKISEKTETVAWSYEGRHLLVAGNGMTIDIFRTEDLLNDDYEDSEQVPFALRVPVTDALEYMDFNENMTMLTTAHQDGTVQLWTFMSDDPTINERMHRKVRREQDEVAKAEGRVVE
jgi:WD40 repeat protein